MSEWRSTWKELFGVEPSAETQRVMNHMAALCRGDEADVLMIIAMYLQYHVQMVSSAFDRLTGAYGDSIERTIDAVIEKNDRIAGQLSRMEVTMSETRDRAREAVDSLRAGALLADPGPVRGRMPSTQAAPSGGSTDILYRFDLKLVRSASVLLLVILVIWALKR